MSEPLVSIITPLYNGERYIAHNISSIQRQEYGNWEQIIVDDGSTDNGAEIVRRNAAIDHRIILVEMQENGGPAAARNKGIAIAKGEYIAFLDADDQWEPEKLRFQISFMLENQVLLSYTSYRKKTKEGIEVSIVRPKEKLTYNQLLRRNQIGCLTAVYDARALGKIYMPNINKRQDFGLWLDILKHPKVREAKLVPSKVPLANYRISENSVSSNKFDLVKYNWLLLRRHQRLSPFRAAYFLLFQIINKLRRG